MPDFRAIKKDARDRLHRLLRVPAIYISPAGVPTPVGVRLHTEPVLIGQPPGGGAGYAEQAEFSPSIVFSLSEGVTPARGGVVSVSATQAYRIEYTFPSDGVTIKAQVVELLPSQIVGFPVPA